MKWAYYIKYKISTVCFMTGLLVLILAGNFRDKKSFTRLDHSMSAILHDRLQPATYIYGISNRLYENRLLLEQAVRHAPYDQILQQNTTAIAGLIKSYEATVLTPEEKKQWSLFKKQLEQHRIAEAQFREALVTGDQGVVAYPGRSFSQTIAYLDRLNTIQVGEGTSLFNKSHSIINDTELVSHLETGLLIILGLCILVLLSISDNNLFRQRQQQLWN